MLNYTAMYHGDVELEKLYLGDTVLWEKQSPSFNWDETKIGVVAVDRNGDPTGEASYFMTHDDVVSYLNSQSTTYGFWVHVGNLMNPVPTLANYQYYRNYELRFLDLQNQTSIPEGCFGENPDYGATILERVTGWQGSVVSIGECAFEGQPYLESIVNLSLPNVVSIGEYAFHDCQSIESITLNPSLQSIGNYAFSGCSNLKSFTIPTSLSVIPEGMLSWTGITSIVIPGNITAIEWGAFNCCEDLSSVTLNYGLQTIGEYAFSDTESLTSITIPSSVTSISSNAFDYDTNLTSIIVQKPQGSISGAPWGATNAVVTWTG